MDGPLFYWMIAGLRYTSTFDAITAEVEIGLKFMYILCLEAKGRPQWKKKTFSFGRCPNHLNPPP